MCRLVSHCLLASLQGSGSRWWMPCPPVAPRPAWASWQSLPGLGGGDETEAWLWSRAFVPEPGRCYGPRPAGEPWGLVPHSMWPRPARCWLTQQGGTDLLSSRLCACLGVVWRQIRETGFDFLSTPSQLRDPDLSEPVFLLCKMEIEQHLPLGPGEK